MGSIEQSVINTQKPSESCFIYNRYKPPIQ
jgi:hypothetical protein